MDRRGPGSLTVSKALAARLGFTLVDTGAIYRCVALQAQRQGIAFDDDAGLARLLTGLEVSFRTEGDQNQVFLDGVPVSEAIERRPSPSSPARCRVGPVVRAGLLDLQRRLATEAGKGAILEGW